MNEHLEMDTHFPSFTPQFGVLVTLAVDMQVDSSAICVYRVSFK